MKNWNYKYNDPKWKSKNDVDRINTGSKTDTPTGSKVGTLSLNEISIMRDTTYDNRRLFTDKQVERLKEYYLESRDMDSERKTKLAKEFNCTEKQIYAWFQRQKYLQRYKFNDYGSKRYTENQIEDLKEYYSENPTLRLGLNPNFFTPIPIPRDKQYLGFSLNRLLVNTEEVFFLIISDYLKL